MTYRPPSHVPETRWARHLDAVMRDRGWSRVRLFEEVGAELGYAPKSRSGFLPLLIDREPTATQAAVLRQHFGEPPELPDIVSPGGDAHTPGLADLMSALTDLVGELRAEREERLRVRAEFAAFAQENRGMIEDLNGAVAELTLRLQRVEGRAEGPSDDPVAAGAPAG